MAGPRPGKLDGYITIGQVVGPHGIKGGLKVKVLTDFRERFDEGRVLFLAGNEAKIKHSTWHKEQVRIQVSGVKDRNRAEELRWEYIFVPESDQPELEEDEFLVADLIGMLAVTEDGTEIGTVEDVFPSPAHDILVIGDGMVPVVSEFVLDIDLDENKIVLNLIPGMIPGFGDEE